MGAKKRPRRGSQQSSEANGSRKPGGRGPEKSRVTSSSVGQEDETVGELLEADIRSEGPPHGHQPHKQDSIAQKKDRKTSDAAQTVNVHRLRNVGWHPSGVVALSVPSKTPSVESKSPTPAVFCAARDNGTIEVWRAEDQVGVLPSAGRRSDVLATIRCMRTIAGSAGGGVLTSMALVWRDGGDWRRCRLLAGGLDSFIREFDLERGVEVTESAQDSYGGAVWCIRTWQSNVPDKIHFAGLADGQDKDEGQASPKMLNKAQQQVHVAIACEDGCVRLWKYSGSRRHGKGGVRVKGGLTYWRSLPRVEGRVLAVEWADDGQRIVSTGVDGCIHCWSTSSTQEVFRITVGGGPRGGSGQATPCVWSLGITGDGDIVTGDADGNTQFWDGRNGTQLHAYRHHASSVLSLAVCDSPSGKVFASGIDSKVVCFERVEDKERGYKWVFVGYKRPHSHDIRCLALIGGSSMLISGGVDPRIFGYKAQQFLSQHPTPLSPAPQVPLMSTCTLHRTDPKHASGSSPYKVHVLLVQHDQHLDVWQVHTTPAPPPHHGGQHHSSAASAQRPLPPKNTLQIKKSGEGHIVCSAIHPSGKLLVYSDNKQSVPVALSWTEDQAVGSHTCKASLLTGASEKQCVTLPAAQCLAFSPDGGTLVLGRSDSIHILDVVDDELQTYSLVSSDKLKESSLIPRSDEPVRLMQISPDGLWLAVARSSRVELYSMESRSFHAILGPFSQPPSGLAFQPAHILTVVSVDNGLRQFDLVKKKMSALWSANSKKGLPSRFTKLRGGVCGMTHRPENEPSDRPRDCSAGSTDIQALFFTTSAICYADFSRSFPSETKSGGKRRRVNGSGAFESSGEVGENFRVVAQNDPLLFASFLTRDDLLLVETPWASVLHQLPAPLHRHLYGS